MRDCVHRGFPSRLMATAAVPDAGWYQSGPGRIAGGIASGQGGRACSVCRCRT
ncbi:hypothetical protein BD413DRAFT_561389 [Trametes elegans]|nr:hypothetical protein BD413DRAFT_561389 [Trametes elegans]